MLVLMANSYAKATHLPMRMLSEQHWLVYEKRAYEELLDWGRPFHEGKRLFLPEAQGELLSNVLAGSALGEKQAALELATRELARLHHCQIQHPFEGSFEPFSHADATCDNVLVDLESGRATWLDFETIHPVGIPGQFRQADDLRILLCGLAAILPAKELPGMVHAALAVYNDESVLAALKETFFFWNRRPRARSLVMPATIDAQWRLLLQTVSCAKGSMQL
jgi:hypothetical protein